MTATTDTTTTATTELLMLDPATLELDRNIRDTVDTTGAAFAELVDSIRQHGVLQALSATRDSDGVVKIEDGQRRTLAAREAGTPTVPVVVTTRTETGKAREFKRIVAQIETSDRRESITEGQRAAAVAEALDLGISQTKVRKALQLKPDQLKQHAKIGRSATARDALDTGQLDLEQAAIIGAFEAEGDTDAVERLMNVPNWNFRYTANLIVKEREAARERAAAAAPWTERGFVLLDTEPEHGDHTWLHVDSLVDTQTGEPATLTHVDTDPASWSIWITQDEDGRVVLTETGEEIDPTTVDWQSEDGGDDARDGYYHVNQIKVLDAWTADYYTSADRLDILGLRVAATVAAAAVDGEPTDPDTIAARQAQQEADRKEAERAERRKVLRLNKLGDAAITTRRAWLVDYLARKTPPQTAAGFVLASLAGEAHLLTQNHAADTTAELLGIDPAQLHRAALAKWVETMTPARAQVVTLALVLGAYEARTGKDAWRRPAYGGDQGVARYLHYVQSLGYPLSQIEEVMAADRADTDVDPDQ